jgi:SAM-dependent methyltransferase
MLELTGHSEYSQQWTKESLHFESAGIYEQLAAQIPSGKVLEIGCGAGVGTSHLAQGREVLSIDNNALLISAARSHLDGRTNGYRIHECDLFAISNDDRAVVRDFAPSTIVAWFLGGSGIDVYKHTSERPDPIEKGKLYREKIEDIVISSDLLVDSVDLINFVNRGGRISRFSNEQVRKATKDDYDTHVFKSVGFEVFDVRLLDWSLDGSNFVYGAADNPNLAPGASILTITSILARRI